MTGPLQVAFRMCVAHRIHLPRPVLAELHHLFPLYLQHRVWASVDPMRPSTARVTERVPICPTGHSDVHAALDALLLGSKVPRGVGRGELALAKRAMEMYERALRGSAT